MISYDNYYRDYLGLTQEKPANAVIPAERRSRPVAGFYLHHVISTVIDGRLIHSVSPKLLKTFRMRSGSLSSNSIDKGLVRQIDDVMFEILPLLSYNPILMRRMTLDRIDSSQISRELAVSILSEESKPLLVNQIPQRGSRFLEYYWSTRSEAVKEGRYFGIIENDEVAAASFISDIDSGGGNIVVSTKPKYRNKGYGRAVVGRAAEWCLENDIRPIYLAASSNTPSVKLAQGLGFKTMSEEIVVSSYVGISV